MALIDYTFPIIYGNEAGPKYIIEIKVAFHYIYNEYFSSITLSFSK